MLDTLAGLAHRSNAILAQAGHKIPGSSFEAERKRLSDLFSNAEALLAMDADGNPAGFALAGDVEGIWWLHELAVEPELARRGIGTALLKAVIERARWDDHACVGLTTFAEPAFNAPFYRRHGFLVVDPFSVGGETAKRFLDEIPAGYGPADRVLMLKRL